MCSPTERSQGMGLGGNGQANLAAFQGRLLGCKTIGQYFQSCKRACSLPQ